ncbi:MAG: 4-amino-4-deoxychorismate lyase [Bermanella sp.]
MSTAALRWMSICNGLPATQLPVDDRSAALGDGLFETILVRRAQAVWLEEHLQRMAAGCVRLDLNFPLDALQQEINTLLTGAVASDYSVLRLALGRKSAGARGYAPASREANRLIQLAAIDRPRRDNWEVGIRAFICQTRLPETAATAGLKHNNRLAHVLARAERSTTEFPEGVMLSNSGLVIEGVSSNVFLVIDGVLHTPLLELAGVEGVVRQEIFSIAEQLNIPCLVRRIRLDDIYRAQEMFFCNSLAGIWPVHSLDCLHFAAPVLTAKLQSKLEALWYA